MLAYLHGGLVLFGKKGSRRLPLRTLFSHCTVNYNLLPRANKTEKSYFFVSAQNLNISTRSLFFAICFASFQLRCIAISVLFFAEKYHGDCPVVPFQRCKPRVQTKQEKNNFWLENAKNIKKKKLQLWLHSISPNLNHCKSPFGCKQKVRYVKIWILKYGSRSKIDYVTSSIIHIQDLSHF